MSKWRKHLCLLALLALPAQAVQVEGVAVDDKVRIGTQDLQLIGAGLRTRLFFKVYVAALYAPEKKATADEILQSPAPRRVSLHILRELSAAQLLDAFRDGIQANHTPAELEQIKPRMAELEAIFSKVATVQPGDTVVLDFHDGLKITVKGEPKGQIAGSEIQRAVLRIWLGPAPVQDSLKRALLGGAT